MRDVKDNELYKKLDSKPRYGLLPKIIFEYSLSHRFLQTIVNCKEKVGPLKIWQLLTESVRVGTNSHQYLTLVQLMIPKSIIKSCQLTESNFVKTDLGCYP